MHQNKFLNSIVQKVSFISFLCCSGIKQIRILLVFVIPGNTYLQVSLCTERRWNGKLCHLKYRQVCVHVCVSVCTVHICTCVFACEIECKLVVSCRPRCRLMAYRQVIYDLSVAGREKCDTRLSPQINKRCSGAHMTSPLHVCEITFYYYLCLLFCFSPVFSCCFLQFFYFILTPFFIFFSSLHLF